MCLLVAAESPITQSVPVRSIGAVANEHIARAGPSLTAVNKQQHTCTLLEGEAQAAAVHVRRPPQGVQSPPALRVLLLQHCAPTRPGVRGNIRCRQAR